MLLFTWQDGNTLRINLPAILLARRNTIRAAIDAFMAGIIKTLVPKPVQGVAEINHLEITMVETNIFSYQNDYTYS